MLKPGYPQAILGVAIIAGLVVVALLAPAQLAAVASAVGGIVLLLLKAKE